MRKDFTRFEFLPSIACSADCTTGRAYVDRGPETAKRVQDDQLEISYQVHIFGRKQELHQLLHDTAAFLESQDPSGFHR